MKTNKLSLAFEEVSYAPRIAEHYEKYSLLRLSGVIEADSEAGLTMIRCSVTSAADDLCKLATGAVAAKAGSMKISLNGNQLHHGGVYIPAEPASVPWLSVEENIKLGIKVSGRQSDSADIKRAMELTGLEGYEKHIPNNKSYGFRLRIVLARALALNPSFIAVGNILPQMEDVLCAEILDVLQKIVSGAGIPVLLAAHPLAKVGVLHTEFLLAEG